MHRAVYTSRILHYNCIPTFQHMYIYESSARYLKVNKKIVEGVWRFAFKTPFLYCCRYIISVKFWVFLGVVETIVGSLVCCGVGNVWTKQPINPFVSLIYGSRAKIKFAHLTIQRHCQRVEEQQALRHVWPSRAAADTSLSYLRWTPV